MKLFSGDLNHISWYNFVKKNIIMISYSNVVVKILFFLTFCLIEALLVSSISNNIVNESKKPDLTQQTNYTQQIDKYPLSNVMH